MRAVSISLAEIFNLISSTGSKTYKHFKRISSAFKLHPTHLYDVQIAECPLEYMNKYQKGKASLHNPFKHISSTSIQVSTQWKTRSTFRSTFHSHRNLTFIKILS